MGFLSSDVLSLEDDLSPVGPLDATDQLQEGRLSGTVRPNQSNDHSLGKFDLNPFHSSNAAEMAV
jgi:hypothetical protein